MIMTTCVVYSPNLIIVFYFYSSYLYIIFPIIFLAFNPVPFFY